MGAVKNHFHDEICGGPFPRDPVTDASYCPECGEPEVSPSIEAFEVFGEVMCADCAAQLFEAEEDADTLRLANPLEPGFRRLGQ